MICPRSSATFLNVVLADLRDSDVDCKTAISTHVENFVGSLIFRTVEETESSNSFAGTSS